MLRVSCEGYRSLGLGVRVSCSCVEYRSVGVGRHLERAVEVAEEEDQHSPQHQNVRPCFRFFFFTHDHSSCLWVYYS